MSIEFMNQPAEMDHLAGERQISHFMHNIWLSRPDLQVAFDLETADGQAAFMGWFESASLREYGLEPNIPKVGEAGRAAELHATRPHPFYFAVSRFVRKGGRLFRWMPLPVRRAVRNMLLSLGGALARLFSRWGGGANKHIEPMPRPGATLIGYAHGVLGMGEHVRMTAEALAPTEVDFGVFDFAIGVENRQDTTQSASLTKTNRYLANIFHINADQMLTAYCHLGPDFFRDRYNIGFWAWELSKCPDNWLPVIRMVDEIWAPSRFIQACFQERTDKPVTFMPLCVELPSFTRRSRSYFGLPEGHCLFLYMFDFLSYIHRKNPFAAIRAFKEAFPDRSAKAGLVLKVMNGNPDDPMWQEMIALIDNDPRIHVFNKVLSRPDVLALVESCDCFISLHRSEGFGRGPAEAMYLGRPVIVTNYSGNTDFTLPDTSFLVDYELIDVQPGQYVFEQGQVWADADVSHAARHMRTVFDQSEVARAVALKGQQYIKENFSARATGRVMADRLRTLGLS